MKRMVAMLSLVFFLVGCGGGGLSGNTYEFSIGVLPSPAELHFKGGGNIDVLNDSSASAKYKLEDDHLVIEYTSNDNTQIYTLTHSDLGEDIIRGEIVDFHTVGAQDMLSNFVTTTLMPETGYTLRKIER